MQKDELIRRLMETFLAESAEHVRALNRDLLALEAQPQGAARAELLKTLFRTAHSLKGAARSVDVLPIEGACHRLEEILAALRDGRLVQSPELLQLLFSTADAIQELGQRLREKRDLTEAPLAAMIQRLEAAASGQMTEAVQEAAAQPAAATAADLVPASPRPSSPGSGDGFVRVPAEKLDTLLARSGELLAAPRQAAFRAEELGAIHELVARWKVEWLSVERTIQKLVSSKSRGRAGALMQRREPEGPDLLPPRAAAALERVGDNLRRLEKRLDDLTEELTHDAHALVRTVAPLHEEVLRVRMLPFAQACEGLDRAARDMAKARGKEVQLVVEGSAVEMDRSILEALKDPLLHLLRNAVDHGIEPAEERRKLGKPPQGRVLVAAALRGAEIEVSVEDDGRGLALEALREQAQRRGLQPQDAQELERLIFLPGFSTARMITDVSGRGVGLDVVKSRVESLHGTVAAASKAGGGTRFALTVPLTLTTIRALLVAAGGQTFALSSTNVHRLLRVAPAELRSVGGREMLALGGTLVPLASLAETLGLAVLPGPPPGGKVPVVVAAAGEKRMAFVVEELLAEQEVLVKSLGPRLRGAGKFLGGTILPTGRVALILNAAELIRSALRHAPARPVLAPAEAASLAARRRLLVADDSVTTRTLEKSILEAAGFEVLVAVDGAHAWQLLQEHEVDLVVSDVDMPRLDGFSLTAAIRGSKRLRELPVILVTALETEQDKARGAEAGADAYLVKRAFDQKSLLDTIAQLL